MSFTKRPRSQLRADPAATLSVLVEPRPGSTEEQVLDALAREGASKVEVIAPGFISALVHADAIPNLVVIADVHPKAEKQIRLLAG